MTKRYRIIILSILLLAGTRVDAAKLRGLVRQNEVTGPCWGPNHHGKPGHDYSSAVPRGQFRASGSVMPSQRWIFAKVEGEG